MSDFSLPPDPSSPWFIVFFAFMWFAITGGLALLSGWRSLATIWPTQAEPEGERFRFASGAIGMRLLPVSYSSCLTVSVSNDGLGIAILFPFRFLSPPIFIPWKQIASVSEGRFLFFRHVLVQPLNHWSRIKLYGRVGKQVLEASRGRTHSAA